MAINPGLGGFCKRSAEGSHVVQFSFCSGVLTRMLFVLGATEFAETVNRGKWFLVSAHGGDTLSRPGMKQRHRQVLG